MPAKSKSIHDYVSESRIVNDCLIHTNGKTARVVYELRHGALNSDQYVLHRCDESLCILDDHHFVGTCGDNILDSVEKGRHSCFTNVHKAYEGNRGRDMSKWAKKTFPNGKAPPVTKEEVERIKQLRNSGVRWGEIKRLTGRSDLTITRVMRGEYDGKA